MCFYDRIFMKDKFMFDRGGILVYNDHSHIF